MKQEAVVRMQMMQMKIRSRNYRERSLKRLSYVPFLFYAEVMITEAL